jgi:glucose-6-phosphate dehydrogenase assembly protein OpcA
MHVRNRQEGNRMHASETQIKGLDPVAIERQLTEMWRLMNEGQPPDHAGGVTRACVLNLIVCRSAADTGPELDHLLAEVTESSPCRSFVILCDEKSTESGYEAYVSSRCQLSSRGSKQVCGEQITVHVRGAAVQTLRSAIHPLLVADVPVFVWWSKTPEPLDPVFQHVLSLADRLIVDSANFADPYSGLQSVAQFLAEGKRAVSDLNWGRLTTWRSLVASLWDVGEYRPLLQSISTLELDFDAPPGRPDRVSSKALLALGWLASRLSWRLDSQATESGDGIVGLAFQTPDGRVQVTLKSSRTPEGLEGPLSRLVMTSAGRAEFSVCLREDGNKLETISRFGTEVTKIERVIEYEPRTEGARLAAELAFRIRDRVYEEAAVVTARIIAGLKGRDEAQ